MNTADSIVTAINIPQIIECFSSVFCNIWNSFLSFSHLIIHPDSRMILILLTIPILLHCFQWRIVEAMPLLENRYPGSPRSFTRYYLTHNGLRGSIMLSFLVRETRLGFSCRSPRSYIGSPRSFAHLSISCPLLRRPSMVIIRLWVTCWGITFHKLFMIIVVECSLSIAANIGSSPVLPLSQQLYSQGFWFP